MPDESLNFRAFGTDVSAGRMFRGLGDDADDAGDSIHGLGEQSKTLDTRLDETRQHLHALIGEFDRTGDVSLFKDVRRDRSTISMLESMRKEVRGIGDDGDDVGRRFGTGVTKGLGDTLGSLPSQLRGAAILGLAGAATAAAPAVGAAIGGAVLGGIGLGGIIGGIALAAQDPRVKAAGSELGEHFTSGLKDSAKPFIGPLLAEFGTLRRTADTFTADLESGFRKLAPLVQPLAHGIEGLVDQLGPGLEEAFSAAQPVIRALANELPEVGAALSDMLSAISEESDGATEGLIGLLHATEFLAQATGFLIGNLEWEFQSLVDVGAKLDEIKDSPIGLFVSNLGFGFNYLTDQATDLKGGLADATSANHDLYLSMVDTTRATNDDTKALRDFASGLQDQFDPIANMIHRTEDLKKAQKDLAEAIKEHGRHSDEAKAAELRLAEAILASDAAAANAAGTFKGKFTDSMRAALKAGGLTEAQIRDIEKAAIAAEGALHSLEGNYKATVTTEFLSYRAGERELSRRASGGPVMGGRSYWVGENGPEIVTMGANGYVTPAGPSAAMARGSAVTSVEGRIVLDVRGAHDALGQAIAQMLRVDSAFRATVQSYVGA